MMKFILLTLFTVTAFSNPIRDELNKIKQKGQKIEQEVKKVKEEVRSKTKEEVIDQVSEIVDREYDNAHELLDKVEKDLTKLKARLKKDIQVLLIEAKKEGKLSYAVVTKEGRIIKAQFQKDYEIATLEYFRTVGKISPSDYSQQKEIERLRFRERRLSAMIDYEEKILDIKWDYLTRHNFYSPYQVKSPEEFGSVGIYHMGKIEELKLELGIVRTILDKVE